MSPTLLILDDEEAVVRSLKRLFRKEGYNTLTATRGEEALKLLEQQDVGVILSDQRMPEMTGVEFLSHSREIRPDAVRMVLSGYADIEAVTAAVNHGNIYKFLVKPWDEQILRSHVREAFEYYELARRGSQFNKIYENTQEGIVITDAESVIQSVNPAFTTITGYQPDEVVGKSPKLLRSGRHDARFFEEMWRLLDQEGHWQGEIWNRRKCGEVYPQWLSISAIRDPHGNTSQYVALFTDITEQKRNEEQLRHIAYHDALTDLPNRRMFGNYLQAMLLQAEREQRQLAVMFLDLDRFKTINDSYGHDVGDALLVTVAERLKSVLRKSDILARMGGDEFTVLLPKVCGAGDIQQVTDKIREVMAAPVEIGELSFYVTVSIGVSLYPADGVTPEVLMRNADTAMYQAKQRGRDNAQFYVPVMNAAAREQLDLENDLRAVLQKRELEVFYQPKMRLQGEQICGVEALLRWNHPQRGLISPDAFIPLAEETGLIRPIGEWVLQQVCRDALAWQAASLSPLRVAINLSVRQLMEPDLVDRVAQIVEQSGLDAQWLELELTESLLLEEEMNPRPLLERFREMGIRLAIDDFGTGYSSFSYLRQLPVDLLKIDKSFISGLPDRREDRALVENIVTMAHELDLEVVAEGVEREEQRAFLQKLGCDQIQGFLLQRPMPALELVDFMRGQKGER